MLQHLLKEHNIKPYPVIEFDWASGNYHQFDLSKGNNDLDRVDLNDEQSFSEYINQVLVKNGKEIGIGGYGEERSLYSRSDLFEGTEPRTIHLGVDIWAHAGTPVYAPFDATIHSFDNRAYHGDYGPIIILEHHLGDKNLFSLYGHLSLGSLEAKEVGQCIKRGEHFAWLGTYQENFHWPPHLHFQLMWDMQGMAGDYLGVAKASEAEGYLANCPDPHVFLGIS